MSSNVPARILVVDDNPATQYSTSRILKSAGFAVTPAGNGAEALEAAVRINADLVVLDINLPDIDGFELCRTLRSRPETVRTPVLYLSATFVDDVDKAQGADAGADGYLTHPVEAPVLVATVNALLRARRAEEAVELSEARFKAIFDLAPNGIALLSDDLVFMDVNPALCEILARDREAIVGRHLSVFSVQEHQFDMAEMIRALQDSGRWHGTGAVLNAKREHVELEWSISSHAIPHLRLAIVTDITARVLIEADRERLLASERKARASAEEANQLKDEFLAALSHELRTPLNAIVGFARVLQLHDFARRDEAVAASVNAIERNAWVQAQLISDLLDISKITSGKIDLDFQRINAADAVDAALVSIEHAARLKKVTIDTDLEREMDPIWWDPSRFQQVVWNLVDNAVKFSRVGGVVRVRLHQTAAGVELVVADTGRGIRQDFLPHVFDRFRQEDSTSRRTHGGLGLGLSIVQKLVELHGGAIAAFSEGEGAGATFIVSLPRQTVIEEPSRAPDDAPVQDLRGIRVLVVDDNDDARVLLRQTLGGASARVLDVASAQAALDALETFQPHVLVSDLAMPQQDGFDLIRRVRELGWTVERLPAIALTAFAREEDRRRALQAGYQLHVSKPPDSVGLLRVIAALLKPAQPTDQRSSSDNRPKPVSNR